MSQLLVLVFLTEAGKHRCLLYLKKRVWQYMQEDSRIFSSGKTFLLDVGIRGVSKHTCVCMCVCLCNTCMYTHPNIHSTFIQVHNPYPWIHTHSHHARTIDGHTHIHVLSSYLCTLPTYTHPATHQPTQCGLLLNKIPLRMETWARGKDTGDAKVTVDPSPDS